MLSHLHALLLCNVYLVITPFFPFINPLNATGALVEIKRGGGRPPSQSDDYQSPATVSVIKQYLLTALAFSSARCHLKSPPQRRTILYFLCATSLALWMPPHTLAPAFSSVTASVQRVFARELLRSSRDLVTDPLAAPHVERQKAASSSSEASTSASTAAVVSKPVAPVPFDDPSLSIIGDAQRVTHDV